MLSGDREGPVRQLGQQLALQPDQLAWGCGLSTSCSGCIRPLARWRWWVMASTTPSIGRADLGIAVGTGTQIAQDSADLVVLGERLMAVPQALALARSAQAKIRQNLSWAFGYNLLVLPLAAGVLLPGFGLLLTPPLAALLMALSSITVVANALLLRAPA